MATACLLLYEMPSWFSDGYTILYFGQQCIGWKGYYLPFFKFFFFKFSWWLLMVIWVSCQSILSSRLQTKITGWIAFGLVTILILANLRGAFLPMNIQFIRIFQCVFNLHVLMAKTYWETFPAFLCYVCVLFCETQNIICPSDDEIALLSYHWTWEFLICSRWLDHYQIYSL